METYQVTITELKTKTTSFMEIKADEGETTESIILSAEVGGAQITGEDYNYLPAFQKLRDELLSLGYGIKCCGAQVNAIQSGMMGANEKIYLVTMGLQVSRKDIVSIYDYVDINVFPTIEEQIIFSRKWNSSLQ